MIWIMGVISVLAAAGFCVLAWKRPSWGLGLLPVVAAAFVVGGVAFEHVFFLGVAVCLVPVTIILVRVAPSASPLETPWHKTLAGLLIVIFWYLLLLAGLTFVFHVLGPILFVIFIVGVVTYKLSGGYSMALDILSAIGTCMRQSLPLPAALDAAAQGQKTKQALILKRISYWLTQGWPLSESLRRGYEQCPPELLAAIAAGEKMNQLPQTIANLEADISDKINRAKKLPPVHPAYPVTVLVVAFCVVMGLSIFILPTFSEIVWDMSQGQAELPMSTQMLLDFARYVTGRKGLNALIVAIPVFAVSLYLLSHSRRRRNPQRLSLQSRTKDWLKWHLPALHWFERTYSQIQLTETLKVGLHAGYPLDVMLRNAMGLDVNHCFRRRIKNWLERVEQGEHTAGAALQCGFDTMLVWAFDERINKGNTVSILEGLEEVYRSRYNYRLNLVNSIGWPVVILCLGLLVGSIVYAMYMGVFHTLHVTLQYAMP